MFFFLLTASVSSSCSPKKSGTRFELRRDDERCFNCFCFCCWVGQHTYHVWCIWHVPVADVNCQLHCGDRPVLWWWQVPVEDGSVDCCVIGPWWPSTSVPPKSSSLMSIIDRVRCDKSSNPHQFAIESAKWMWSIKSTTSDYSQSESKQHQHIQPSVNYEKQTLRA